MSSRSLLDGKRILIVDDEPDVADSLEQLLSMCDIVKVTDFTSAKNLLETEHFDVAVLDIMGVNGYELLEVANRRKITAVMLTAHALSPDHIVKSIKGGGSLLLAQGGNGQHCHLPQRAPGG